MYIMRKTIPLSNQPPNLELCGTYVDVGRKKKTDNLFCGGAEKDKVAECDQFTCGRVLTSELGTVREMS